jgi:hypothetical protein
MKIRTAGRKKKKQNTAVTEEQNSRKNITLLSHFIYLQHTFSTQPS